jgi:hypothetical protein
MAPQFAQLIKFAMTPLKKTTIHFKFVSEPLSFFVPEKNLTILFWQEK